MTGVKFGVGLFPTEPLPRMLTLVKLSEEMGLSCAYIGDSQMIWREPYVIIILSGMKGKHVDPSVRPWELKPGELPVTWVFFEI